MADSNKGFTYNYSAKQKEEIQHIRQKYLPPQENKLEKLRKLDESVNQVAMPAAMAVGLVSALIFGTGMACVTQWQSYFVLGIIVGLLGLAGMGLTPLLYSVLVRKRREKIAPEILRLTEELSKEHG